MQLRNQQNEGAVRTQTGAGDAQPKGQETSQDPNNKRQMSVIGADIVVTGNIEATVDLHVEGKVIGDVRCATLILGESSAIQGRIYAARVKVAGVVEGAIETRDLAVETGARVSGEITYERLRVANGGLIEGNISFKPSEHPAEETARLKLVELQPEVAKIVIE